MNPTEIQFMEERIVRPDTPCWNWRAFITSSGYGRWHYKGRQGFAHRVVYEMLVGPIPEGMELHHVCCNRACVNPEHLQPMDEREHRSLNKFSQRTRETHCRNGHPRTEENTYTYKDKKWGVRRRCRQCELERLRKPGGWKDPNRQRGTHCPQGHEYTPENTYTYARGGQGGYRYCRECNRAAARKISKRRG